MKLLHQAHNGDTAIYVFDDNGKKILKIGSLAETHSVYDPENPFVEPLEEHYWNMITVLGCGAGVRNLCLIGLGAGTITRQIAFVRPSVHVDGVENDFKVIEAGRAFFHLNQPNLTVIPADGLGYFSNCTKKYDLIVLDAFVDGNLCPQVLEIEWLKSAKEHLNSEGLIVANIIDEKDLRRMALKGFSAVFRHTWIIPVATSVNYLVVGSDDPAALSIGRFKDMPERLKGLAKYIASKTEQVK